jgi:streptogramin lyase
MKNESITPMNEIREFVHPRRSRELFLTLALLIGIALPGAAAQSIGSLTSPEPEAGIKFSESYFTPSIFDNLLVGDMAFNSKGKIVMTTPGSTSGADLWFLGPDGTAANETSNPYPQNGAYGIAVDSKGNFWFANSYSSVVGFVNSKGQITQYSLSGSYFLQEGITLGSDGAMWVLASVFSGGQFNFYVGRFAGDGTFTAYPIPSNVYPGNSQSIATGSDGNVWFQGESFPGSDEVLVSVTPSGKMTSYVTETNCSQNLDPLHAVILGPDGNMWFSSECGLGIGNITPSGVVTFFPFTDPDDPGAGFNLAPGSDGAVWFITPVITGQPDHLGRITTSGSVTYTDISNSLGNYTPCGNDELYPTNLAAGPKGTLQFYATNGEGCGAVISFTPAAPGIDRGNQPPGVQSQEVFACANGATCVFSLDGGGELGKAFLRGQAFYTMTATIATVNGYAVGNVPGENFGLCNKSNGNGQPLYATWAQVTEGYIQSRKSHLPTYIFGAVLNPFSATQTGLKQGTDITCTFPWIFESCPLGGGNCITNNTQTATFNTQVGP